MFSCDTHIYKEGRFFGCYLLNSVNEKYKGRTYIGFTVNPNRRINQHNSGYSKGGAKRTSGKGPWEMALIVHGFPNEISALRFEWAWQNPEKSVRLKHLVPKSRQYSFPFKFSILCEMLRIGPWCRLPLTIRWLKQEYQRDFPLNKLPPNHMAIDFGFVQIVRNKKSKANKQPENLPISSQYFSNVQCVVCKSQINLNENDSVFNKMLLIIKCANCAASMHTICLANHFLKGDEKHLMPVDGHCPKCNVYVLWGDLVKFRLDGFRKSINLENILEDDEENENDSECEEEDEEEFVELDDEDEACNHRGLEEIEDY